MNSHLICYSCNQTPNTAHRTSNSEQQHFWNCLHDTLMIMLSLDSLYLSAACIQSLTKYSLWFHYIEIYAFSCQCITLNDSLQYSLYVCLCVFFFFSRYVLVLVLACLCFFFYHLNFQLNCVQQNKPNAFYKSKNASFELHDIWNDSVNFP